MKFHRNSYFLVELNQLKLFEFSFGENKELFAVSKDLKSVFKVTQIGGLESGANSCFFDDSVISGTFCVELFR